MAKLLNRITSYNVCYTKLLRVGCGKLGLKTHPTDIPTKQALAAIGQCELMYFYDNLFSIYNHTIAQVLLTKDIIEFDERKNNCKNTLTKLLSIGTIPIINENDTVSVDEIRFGDNDTLSAIVSELIDADLLIILSDIDGFVITSYSIHYTKLYELQTEYHYRQI